MEPEVSVVIPAFNCEKTLKAAVDSALHQDICMEVIIIDDASTQDFSEVLSKYEDNPQVRISRNETNIGVAASRNRGVAMAKGEYIAFLDADDIWRDEKLKKQLSLIKKTGAVLCSTARELITTDGELTGRVICVPERITYKKLLYGNVINCSSVLLKREVALKYPMGDDDIHEDYICWLSILKEYGEAFCVNEPLLLYRTGKNSKSGSKLKSAKMTYKVYKKMGFSTIKAIWYFTGYAINGVIKYTK